MLTNGLTSLELKWKRKHWWLLMLFNASIPFLLAINRIMVAHSISYSTISHLLLMSICPPIIMTLFAYYCWMSYKEWQDYKEVIKDTRMKYFYRGVLASFASFNLLIIALVVSYSVGVQNSSLVSYVVYSIFGVTCFLGVLSSIFSTMYEFCAAFDIFYNKNKETLVKAYLEQQDAQLKIIKDCEN